MLTPEGFGLLTLNIAIDTPLKLPPSFSRGDVDGVIGLSSAPSMPSIAEQLHDEPGFAQRPIVSLLFPAAGCSTVQIDASAARAPRRRICSNSGIASCCTSAGRSRRRNGHRRTGVIRCCSGISSPVVTTVSTRRSICTTANWMPACAISPSMQSTTQTVGAGCRGIITASFPVAHAAHQPRYYRDPGVERPDRPAHSPHAAVGWPAHSG